MIVSCEATNNEDRSNRFPVRRLMFRTIVAGLLAMATVVFAARMIGDERDLRASAASGLLTLTVVSVSLLPMRNRPVKTAFAGFLAGMIFRSLACLVAVVLLVKLANQPVKSSFLAMIGVYVVCLVVEVSGLIRFIDETNRLRR